MNDSEIAERFLLFFPSARLMNKYAYYNFRNELLAQTYDITAVTAVHLNDLQIKIKLSASQALFPQCHV